MARSYATFDCGIWDPETGFCDLSAGAQRTYFMLVTQRDIGACGSLALTLRRWGATCSENDLETWLKELAEADYIMIDDDTEEVLVRTFMKWDAGYKHAKRVQAVIASALAIRSLSIRNLALAELARLGVSIPNREAIDSRRSGLTNVTTDHTPETTLQEREPSPSRDVGPPSMFCPKHPEGTTDKCGPCGTARKQFDRWNDAQAERAENERAATRRAIRECTRCNRQGFIEDTGGQLLGRCDHQRSSA